MKNESTRATCIAALVSLLGCLPAAAAERGFYAGGYYSQNDSDAARTSFANQTAEIYRQFDFTPAQSGNHFDAKDSGYGFFGGYRWLRHLAFEGGYTDLGEVSYRDESSGVYDDPADTDPPTNESWSQSTSRSMTGITLSALAILPLSYRAEIYARGGVLFSSTKANIRISDGVGNASGRVNDSSTDFLAGVGASFTVIEIYTLRLEYQRIFDAGNATNGFTAAGLGESDIDVINLGFTVTF